MSPPREGPPTFPLVDRFLSISLGLDVATVGAGQVAIVESPRRVSRELSYGYIRAFLGLWFEDGRTALSVPPGARAGIDGVLEAMGSAHRTDRDWLRQLTAPINEALWRAGVPAVRDTWDIRYFACNSRTLREVTVGACRRLVDDRIPPVEGLALPMHCFPDGLVYGVVEGGRVVSVAYAHRTGVMEGQVADLGVETAEAYRRRGYGKAVVSAVTAHVARVGGEGLYQCRVSNRASMATAQSVGYELYAKGVVFAADVPAHPPGA